MKFSEFTKESLVTLGLPLNRSKISSSHQKIYCNLILMNDLYSGIKRSMSGFAYHEQMIHATINGTQCCARFHKSFQAVSIE